MARRQLDAGFWDDPDVARLCVQARLLLICMITDTALSDDYGVLPADATVLKKHAFGYDEASVAQVQDWRDEILSACRNVVRFVVDGREYIHLRRFAGYQGIRYKRKSNYPAPPTDCVKAAAESPKPAAVAETPAPDCGHSAADCGKSAPDCGNSAAISRGFSALDELSRDEVRRAEVSRGEAVRARAREGATIDPPAPAPATKTTTTTTDPLTAQFYLGLQRLGVLVSSQAQAETYNDVVGRIRGHPQAQMFVTQLLEEAARSTTGRITPRWFEAVVERCLREGRLPGGRPPASGKSRDAPEPRYAGPAVDWDEVQAQLAREEGGGHG